VNPTRARKRRAHRHRRERKAHFGELVQLDGSFHCWYDARAARGCASRQPSWLRSRFCPFLSGFVAIARTGQV
jgi:hypothetical protein